MKHFVQLNQKLFNLYEQNPFENQYFKEPKKYEEALFVTSEDIILKANILLLFIHLLILETIWVNRFCDLYFYY